MFCSHSQLSTSTVYSENYLCPVSMSLIQHSPVIFQIKQNKMEPDSDSDKEQNEKKRLKSGGEGICCVCASE